MIELNFNADKDHYRIYQWTRALEKSIENCRNKTSKLGDYLKQNTKIPIVQTCLPMIKDH